MEPNEGIHSGRHSKEGLAIPKYPEGEENCPPSGNSQEGPQETPGGGMLTLRLFTILNQAQVGLQP